MARKIIMVLAALSLATAAFANGQNEQAPGFGFQGDKLTLKGIVSLQSFPHPILKSGDKQYVLMVPPYLVDRAGVKDGTQVTVQGYQLSDLPRCGWAENDKSYVGFFVTQATVGGKDYDLARYYGPWMMRGRGYGPGYGMMGPGYGRGYGMMGRGYGPGYGMMGPGYGRGYGMGPWDDDR